jgi:hypothetical protein
MSKRFIDTERHRKELRGVDCKLRLAHEWLWQNCDAAGVWSLDTDLFKFECGYALNVEALLKACQWVKQLSNGSLFLTDFVQVNYGTLKPGYNPHKPVYRSLQANGIDPETQQFEDLPNPCLRVEEEGEEEDSSKKKEHATEIRDERFEALWKTYQGKGAKGKARDYWAKLNEEDRAAIIAKAPAYVASTMDDRLSFRKNLEGWINPAERRWEAPVITQIQATNGQQTDEQRRAERNRIIAERYAGQ